MTHHVFMQIMTHQDSRETAAEDISGLLDHLKGMLLAEPLSPKAAGEKLKSLFPLIPEDYSRSIDRAVAELEKREQQIITLRPAPTVSSRRQNRWYLGPREHSSPNWTAYRKHLAIKGWGNRAIDLIDRSSTKITNELLCPNGDKEDRFQGLVLGYVQSGKTATMAGTIAKAADSGYRMVIVLAGITNVLRQQTQSRLESDILRHNPSLWEWLTTAEQDFRLDKGIKLPTPDRGKCVLLVVKKNAAVLRRFKKALAQLSLLERKALPTLIIDDECDQASINTSAYRCAVSRINGLIRDLCERLPKVSYVGFTATPYANVLMAETAVDGTRDLYPSEFIVSLDEPESYFGARRLFGKDSVADTEGELPFIRRVPDEDRTLLQPASRRDRDAFCPGLTPSLVDACDYFILALAARRARGREGCHCCMLIHTTIYAACHRRIRRMVETDWLDPLISELRGGDGARIEALRTLWDRERRAVDTAMRTDLSCPPEPESFDDLRSHLLPAAESISMTVENSEAELSQRLDFNRAEPLHSIVIGGNVLARGLTIEGLVCSFFIRSSNQYDTLMQMGRWFGYRRGYEDLPRIWMTRELENAFRDLVNVEEMIRSEIIEITRMGWTPSEMAVRVPQIASLSITARNKLVMENLEECDVSFYGTHQQTISFPVDNEYHRLNWNAGHELVQTALCSRGCCKETKGSSCLMRDVGYRHVLRFLRSYKVEKDSMQGMTEFIEREIDNGEESMEIWNVGIIGAKGGRTATLGGIHDITLVTRTKINPGAFSRSGGSIERELNTQIYIKALMGVGDTLLDVDRRAYTHWLADLVDPGFDQSRESWLSVKRYRNHAMGGRPLLLLYPIDRLSEPRGWDPARPVEEHERLPLLYGLRDAGQLAGNILGIGIVFPQSTRATARHCVRVKLSRDDEGEAFDDAEIERLERLMEDA